MLGSGPDKEVCQRKTVQEHVAAHGQVAGSHTEPPQPAAVVKGAAADDLQAVRQGDLLHEIATHRVQLLRGSSPFPEVEVIAAMPSGQVAAKGLHKGAGAVRADFIAAERIGPG